jgi:predicted acylesterase/phospholipase RssA
MSGDFFDIIMKPLLLAKELTLDVTLDELYHFNKKEIHIMTVELNTFQRVNLSYKTHPSLKVMDAIKMSCAFPVLFSPKVFIETELNKKEEGRVEECKRVCCYIDGGVMCNYPVNICIEDQQCNPDEILGFRNMWEKYHETIDGESSLVDFLKICVKQMIRKLENEKSYVNIKNEVSCVGETIEYTSWFDLCSDEKKRMQYINRGMTYAELFLRMVNKGENVGEK